MSGGHFYADMIVGPRCCLLDGPFTSEPAARDALPAAKRLALDTWAAASFASFGTCQTTNLGPGKLSARLRECAA